MNNLIFFAVQHKEKKTFTTVRNGATPQLYTTLKRAESCSEIRYAWLRPYYEIVKVELKVVW